MPCDTVHWTMEDDDHSFWLYTACGLVRIARTELDAWIADPKHTIETTVWDAADGVRLRSTAASGYGPRVAKSTDGKMWFVTGDGVQVIDPRHLPVQQTPAAGAHRTNYRRPQDSLAKLIERGTFEPAPAAADSRSGDRLHRSEPGRAGEDPFQIQAGRLGSRLAGRGQSPPGVLYQSFACATIASA